jgi:hypothetical protein
LLSPPIGLDAIYHDASRARGVVATRAHLNAETLRRVPGVTGI